MRRIVLLMLFAIVCTVFAGDCKKKCKPNTRFEVDCNTCICTKDGNIACTDRTCPPPPEPEPPKVCKPGSTFMIDCNTCICSDDGTSAGCTKIGCPPRED